MEKMNKYMKALLMATVTLTGFSLSSCEDEPDKYEIASGNPTVYYIRCLSSEVVDKSAVNEQVMTNGQLVEEAGPQSTLCLVGENLRSITEMFFNDQKAVLNNSYITDNTLIVVVPKNVPKAVTDKIYMINAKNDTTTIDFHVIIPGPTLFSMDLEYAKPGSEVTISGRYLIDDPAIPLQVFFKDANDNDTEAVVKSISDDFTSVVVEVPANAAEGNISVKNVYGKVTSGFMFMDSGNGKESWMLFDFDGKTGLGNHGWHPQEIRSDEWSISGNYLQLGNGEAAMDDETWDDSHFSFEYWPGNWKDTEDYSDPDSRRLIDIADFSAWEDMSMKFEMCVPKNNPWTACALQIIPASTTTVTNGNAGTDIYGLPTGGCNNVYISGDEAPRALYRPWTSGTNDTNDKWITVTLPLKSNFIYGYKGGVATGKLTSESWSSLTLFLASGGVAGTPCTPILKIDNIRVGKY